MIKLKYLSFSIFIHFSLIFLFILLVKAQVNNVSSKYIELNLELFSVLKDKSQGSGRGKRQFKRKKIVKKEKLKKVSKKNTLMKQAFLKPRPVAKKQIVIKEKPKVGYIKKSLTSNSISKGVEANTHFDKSVTDLKENSGVSETGNETGSEKNIGGGKGKKGRAKGIGDRFLLEKFHIISKIVQKNIKYPFIARRMGWEGKVLISFLLTRNGEIKYLKVEKSSGYKILDENALKTIKRCSKYFPVPPVDVKIKLPIIYKLE